MKRKFLNAALGLCLGIVSLPIAFVIYPAFCAWIFWNETDDGEEE